jgi:hypothetical protein
LELLLFKVTVIGTVTIASPAVAGTGLFWPKQGVSLWCEVSRIIRILQEKTGEFL